MHRLAAEGTHGCKHETRAKQHRTQPKTQPTAQAQAQHRAKARLTARVKRYAGTRLARIARSGRTPGTAGRKVAGCDRADRKPRSPHPSSTFPSTAPLPFHLMHCSIPCSAAHSLRAVCYLRCSVHCAHCMGCVRLLSAFSVSDASSAVHPICPADGVLLSVRFSVTDRRGCTQTLVTVITEPQLCHRASHAEHE